MSSNPNPNHNNNSTVAVDPSLWWDPFTLLLSHLQHPPLSDDRLAKKLKDNHEWFVETVARFKPRNDKSRTALNSAQRLKIGSHEIMIKPELKDKALHISSCLNLDEVQSYILVERSFEQNDLSIDSLVADYVHVVLLDYHTERQSLLMCTRLILMHALHVGIASKEKNTIRDEALKLISDGLNHKLISVLHDLLSSSYPEQMDVDIFTLWAEETLIEDNFVLEIIFLIYYESLCSCNFGTWKELCSLYKGILSGSCNLEKLAISNETMKLCYHAKVRLLLILIETLDLENLFLLLHDGIPFREGASSFSANDIHQMDTLVSSFNAFAVKEAGALILAWAVCLCIISSLPGKEENNMLMEIDHAGYVRQAFNGQSLSYLVEILESDMLKGSAGPVPGYRSVLRTFISAFIACYEINPQLEDSTLNLILDIICKVYRGEESLCVQFWDKESFIDEPIRCLLCNLESEFPFRTMEFVRLLSSLSEGSWPAECVFNFLDKSTGISSLFEITSESLVDNDSQIVEARIPFHVPGVESLVIPSKTRGQVLKVIGGNTVLIRWEYAQSGVLVLLLRLAQELYLESNEEVLLVLDLLSQMVSFNMAVVFSLIGVGDSFCFQEIGMNGQMEKNSWVIVIICSVIKKSSPNSRGVALMSMGVSILAKMLNCAPSQIAAVALKANIFEMALKTNIFDAGYGGSSSGSWFLSGKLAKMLLIDSKENGSDNPLAISVLEFTLQLLKTGVENDLALALVAFSLQYILVNHEYWKYGAKHIRWKVTLKALAVMKACVMSVSISEKLGVLIRDMLLCDSSIHSTLFRLSCTTKQTLENLYINRHFELVEIEGFQLAIGSALDILCNMLSKFSKDMSPSLPLFHQAVLSAMTKPMPVVLAVTSLISYSQDPAIQVGAAKTLSALFIMADCLQPYFSGNLCLALEEEQITVLRHSVKSALLEDSEWNEDLFFAVVNLLTSAARYQPAFLVAILFPKEDIDVQLSNAVGMKQPANEASYGPPNRKDSSVLNSLMHYVERSDDFIDSRPSILLAILEFLKALWEGAGHYVAILECLKESKKFWKQLTSCISLVDQLKVYPLENLNETRAHNLTCKYQCQAAILDIMAYDMFLMKKLLHAESLLKEASESKEINQNSTSTEKSKSAKDIDLKDILMTWCERSILGNMIKLYTSWEYNISEISYHAKVAASLFIVHVMKKLVSGDAGSLSVSLLEKIHINLKNLRSQSSLFELLAQYSQRGYSEGKELEILVLNDLYYHLQGELGGRKIGPGPFKELSQYVVESNCLQTYQYKYNYEQFASAKDVFLYDLKRIRSDLGLKMWDYTEWKASKTTVEIMLKCMLDANSVVLLGSSKFSALKALITVLTLFEDNSLEKKTTTRWKIPDQLCFSCIDYICQSLRATIESLAPALDACEQILDSLAAEAELLHHLMRSVQGGLPLSVCIVVMQTSRCCIKMLSDFGLSVAGIKRTMKLLLMLLLLAVEFCRTFDKDSEQFVKVSNDCLGLLPILCNCITASDQGALSLTTIDVVLRNFLTPTTWFPIVQKHLQLQHVILSLQDKSSLASIQITLKFLLTLARVRGGAEMLLGAGFLYSLKVLFDDLLDGWPSTVVANNNGSIKPSEKIEKTQQIWGLGLAVITAMVQSLGDGSSCTDIMDNVIPYLFSEKAYLISYYLNAPDFPSENHKKRPRAQRTETSFVALKETEHTLALMCTLAKHWNSWVKAMKETDSQLREKSIHLLAFISRGIHRLGESPGRTNPLLCPPILKEEFECCKRPSFVNSRHGWFALTPLCCMSKYKFSAVSSTSTALVIKGQPAESSMSVSPTYFSDLVALQIYRIAFLILKFLCLEAEGAAKRSEDVGFVDLAHIPELPMPEILHLLQDQAIAIVCELCDANKLNRIDPEIQSVCLLMLQIMEMALYLEFCVLQICGIRPVLGRVEDFSREVKSLLKAMEGHVFLRVSMKSMKQIISVVYPGLLQTEGFL